MMTNFKRIIQNLTRSANQDSIENADQVEWQAVIQGSAAIEYGISDEIISGEIIEDAMTLAFDDDDDPEGLGDAPRWSSRAELEERQVGATADEIERRKLILGSQYPFEVDGNNLTYRGGGNLLYEFCLATSVSPSLTKNPFTQLPRTFEALAKDVLVAWLGPGTSGWQTGFPGRTGAGLPNELSKLWNLIEQETGEWRWQPGASVPEDAEDDQKDLGVDLLVYKTAGDFRTHALFLAGQCACGRDAFAGAGKAADLNQKWLAQWFRDQSQVDWVPCLLLPRCVGSSASELRITSGVLFFDRIRLILAASLGEKPIINNEMSSKLSALIEMVHKGDQLN